MAGLTDVKRAAGGAAAGISEELISQVFAGVVALVKAGEQVQIKGFGTFKRQHTEAREGINPQDPTGPKINISAKDHLKFKASPTVDVSPAKAAPAGRRR